VYSSSNTLDGTTVHPDDYRLAERLIAHANITMPAAAPDNWTKPNYAELDVANAAATIEHAKQVTEEPFAGSMELEDAGGEIVSEEAVQSPDASPTDNGTTEIEVPSVEATSDTTTTDTTTTAGSAVASADVPGSESVAESTSDTTPATGSDGGESNQPTVPLAPRSSVPMPPIATAAMERPTLSIDVERLARSWQVGREKMKRVANCLQFSFADSRDFQFPLPLLCKVPRLDNLQSGMMLQALVIGVADFGVFVDLGPDCSGLIHISRLAPDFIEDPHQFVQVGDLVPVWVLNVDEKKKRVSLTAIPPGTPSRRNEHGSSGPNEGSHDRGGQGRGNQVGGDNRNQRNDRNQAGARDSGPRQSQPHSADRTGQPTGSGGDRSRSSGGDSRSSRGGGNRGDKSFGRDGNRDRGRNKSESGDSSQSRRPTRVDPPKPVTPISDAMQKGKEPLRSFSDLLQFIKKSKDEPTVEQTPAPELETSVRSSDTQNETPVENSSQGVETTDRGDASAPSA
jgi:predicted RNA-binding protein with RPS1 domain